MDDLTGDTVTAAWVHGDEVAYSWYGSMLGLIIADMGNQARLFRGGNIAMPYSTGGIVFSRNKTVETFLERDVPWLWWVDTDMGFEPDVVELLMAAADAEERPVVGGLCFAMKHAAPDTANGFVGLPLPTLYQWGEMDGKEGFVPMVEYPRDSLVQCAGTGSACILIHRSVFERIAEDEGPNWYTPVRHPDLGEVSEDLSFCLRLARLGIPLWVNTAAKTTHLKHVWTSEAMFDVFKRNAEEGRSFVAEASDALKPKGNRAERRRKAKVK